MSLFRRKGDWRSLLAVVQASGTPDDRTWSTDVVREAKTLFGQRVDMGMCITSHSHDCISAHSLISDLPHELSGLIQINDEVLQAVGIAGFRRYFYPPRHVTTHLEVERDAPPEIVAAVSGMRTQLGVADSLGILAHPVPGRVVVLCNFSPVPVRLSRSERELLTRIAIHLETSFRLRLRPELVKAELDERGRVLHREEDAPPSPRLTEHAQRLTRAHSRHVDAEEAVELWPALVEGRYSLVERGSGKGKRYLVVENPPAAQPMRALDPRELEVVTQASRGLAVKMIAYALGISPTSVANRMTSAAAKVGVATRLELVRLAATLSRDPRAGFETMALTDAERDVLELLQLGLSNDEIAKMRSRSVRTIANQVASLLRKTGSPSRRGLFQSTVATAGS